MNATASTAAHDQPACDIIAVARGHYALLMELSGIRTEQPGSPEQAEDIIESLLEQSPKVLIIQRSLHEALSEPLRRRLERHHGRPEIIDLPAFERGGSQWNHYVNRVIKPAIGYEIRFD